MYPCNWILSLVFLVVCGIIRAMYIEVVPNRKSPPAILLRQAYREDGKVKKRTLANLTDWPKQLIEGFRALLKGGKVVAAEREAVSILRSLPHGHVAAALGTLQAIGLDRVLGPPGNRRRDLVIAMVVSRLIAPGSKLATARGLDPATATSSLGEVLGLRAVDEDELYGALDWLLQRQPAIEKSLARKHLADGVLVLYDVASSYLEGRCCPWPSSATTATARRASCRSSMACCAPPTAARWRSKCSTATPPIPRPWPPRSPSSRTASA